MSVFFLNFTLILLKLDHALITADLLHQNPTKNVMLLYKKIVLIRCCKWISFQSAEYNHKGGFPVMEETTRKLAASTR